MSTYIALLRGINVGGRNKLPMRELTDVFNQFAVQNVKTYIQSGNVVFQAEAIDIVAFANTVSNAIHSSHGFTLRVFLLTREQLEQALAANPYPEAESDPKTLHLYFLNTKPDSPDMDKIQSLKKENERVHLTDTVFYLYAPDGIGRSKLAERVERLLGVAVTARNWRSASKILELANSL